MDHETDQMVKGDFNFFLLHLLQRSDSLGKLKLMFVQAVLISSKVILKPSEAFGGSF